MTENHSTLEVITEVIFAVQQLSFVLQRTRIIGNGMTSINGVKKVSRRNGVWERCSSVKVLDASISRRVKLADGAVRRYINMDGRLVNSHYSVMVKIKSWG